MVTLNCTEAASASLLRADDTYREGNAAAATSTAAPSNDRQLTARLSRNVPRYTSYPTAPHFTAAVGPDVYMSWLRTVADDARLSLYLHVPYCAELCHYCGCHTKAIRRREPIEVYGGRLIEEIGLLARELPGRRVTHLHWGGGTPSMLGPDLLCDIHRELGDAFDLAPLREHAIELDPRHLTPGLARTLADIGINRASLGVQDFTASVQHAIGRIQPFQIVMHAVDLLHEVGIEKINFDLMYGLPGQTVQSARRTAMLAQAMAPHRLAIFGYAHVPWMKPQQRLISEAILPGPQERLAQAQVIHETLMDFGYQPIGLDHYARCGDELAVAACEGHLHRNFQGYTSDDADTLIGLGASAISRFAQGYAQNAPDIGSYKRAIGARRFATLRGIAFSADDRLRGRIIERLMCDMAVDLDMTGDEMGDVRRDYFDDELQSLIPLEQEGLVEIDTHCIRVTEKGRPFLRVIATAFDAYLADNRGRHSVAV